MGNFMPPEGFQYDAASGKYFKQEMVNDGYHPPYPVISWFDPNTGKVVQNPAPMQQGGYPGVDRMPPQTGYPGGNGMQPPQPRYPGGNAMRQPAGYPGGNAKPPQPSGKGGRTALIVILVVLLCVIAGLGSVVFYKLVIADDNKKEGSSGIASVTTTENAAGEATTSRQDTEMTTEAVTERKTTEEVTEKKTTEEVTEKKTTEQKTEQKTEKKTEAPVIDYGIGWIEGDFAGTDPNLEGAEPVISINGNGKMDMTLNFGEGFNSYKCIYETSGKEHEMDDLYVYVTVLNPDNGIPSHCTLVFSDSPDYFYFLDEGFGIMGYSGAPYYFTRVN